MTDGKDWKRNMAHWRSMFENKYIGHWDFPDGKDFTLTIDHVEQGELQNQRGTDKKPLVFFKEAKKPLALNKTNAKTIDGLYGGKVEEWAGKRITLYAAETSVGGETVPCVRIRNKAP